MKTPSFALPVLALALAAGCTSVHKTGTSRVDAFDAIRVDQMTGNQIAPRVMAKSILCLNARRETRWINALTNVSIHAATNVTITPVTNLTVSIATNFQYTVMTNLGPLPPAPPVVVAPGDAPPAVPAPATAAAGPAPPAIEATTNAPAVSTPVQLSTNLTLSLANNQSGTHSPNQAASNLQTVRSYNNQLASQSNNLTITLMTNRVVTAETNLVVTWITNTAVVSFTNVSIIPTNYPDYDYFLVSELIPPQDFIPATSGESLVLLIDGARHGFSSSQSGTTYVSRRGFASTLYRVPAQVLVDIANAREVRVRFRGVNSTLERTMSEGSRKNFKDFLLKYFTSDPPAGPGSGADKKMAAAQR